MEPQGITNTKASFCPESRGPALSLDLKRHLQRLKHAHTYFSSKKWGEKLVEKESCSQEHKHTVDMKHRSTD